jgi:hypothetical protein
MQPIWSRPGWIEPMSVMCGVWLCVSTPTQTLALDPSTGQVRWKADWPYASGPGSRLVAYRMGSSGPRGVAVVEPGTGRVLYELSDFRPLTVGEPRWVPVLQPDTVGSYELGVLDLKRLLVIPLATLIGYGDCRAGGGYVACRLAGGQIKVWGYRILSG